MFIRKSFSDTFLFDLDVHRWDEAITSQTPPPRCGHTADVVGADNVVVCGGIGSATLDDVWMLDCATMKWTEVCD